MLSHDFGSSCPSQSYESVRLFKKINKLYNTMSSLGYEKCGGFVFEKYACTEF